MIKISRQVDYALQFILELSKLEKDALISLKKFSIKSNISFLFLQKIARLLKKAGIIIAVKGKDGGYKLSAPASNIKVLEVIEAIEGPYGITDCSSSHKCSKGQNGCNIKRGVNKINSKIINIFESLSVTDMMV